MIRGVITTPCILLTLSTHDMISCLCAVYFEFSVNSIKIILVYSSPPYYVRGPLRESCAGTFPPPTPFAPGYGLPEPELGLYTPPPPYVPMPRVTSTLGRCRLMRLRNYVRGLKGGRMWWFPYSMTLGHAGNGLRRRRAINQRSLLLEVQ